MFLSQTFNISYMLCSVKEMFLDNYSEVDSSDVFFLQDIFQAYTL